MSLLFDLRRRENSAVLGSLALALFVFLMGVPMNRFIPSTPSEKNREVKEERIIRVELLGDPQFEGIYHLPVHTTVLGLLRRFMPERELARVHREVLHRELADFSQIALNTGPSGVTVNVASMPAGKAFLLGAPMDLNRAEVWDLTLLPGIGPVLARRISADRDANGLYRSPQDLDRISGISTKTIQRLEPMVVTPMHIED